jgi:hypothetical protein
MLKAVGCLILGGFLVGCGAAAHVAEESANIAVGGCTDGSGNAITCYDVVPVGCLIEPGDPIGCFNLVHSHGSSGSVPNTAAAQEGSVPDQTP